MRNLLYFNTLAHAGETVRKLFFGQKMFDFNTLAHAGETSHDIMLSYKYNFNTLAHAGETLFMP